MRWKAGLGKPDRRRRDDFAEGAEGQSLTTLASMSPFEASLNFFHGRPVFEGEEIFPLCPAL